MAAGLAACLLVWALWAGKGDPMLDGFIENQIFFPDPHLAGDPGELGLAYEDVTLQAAGGVRLHGWWIPAPGEALLLFFHGNAGNISHRLDNLARLHQAGVSVFILDYRGYGKSTGRISEQGLYQDAQAALDWAAARAGEEGLSLVLFGRSLGGVAAVSVAHDPRVAGVILESTFTNLGDMARHHFPLPGLGKLSRRFASLDRIAGVAAPKLFIHGDADDIVPYALGQRLYEAAAPPKDFYTIPGAGHNDTYVIAGPAYFRRVGEFLAGLSAPAPAKGS